MPVIVAKTKYRNPVLEALDVLEGKKPAKKLAPSTVAAELKASRRGVKKTNKQKDLK